MDITKADLDDFFTRLEALENDKKQIADEMKESIASFASSLDINKKSVVKAFKAFKEANKNKEEFVLVDLEADQLLITVFPEFNTDNQEQ